jgi:DnaK suppressor protein
MNQIISEHIVSECKKRLLQMKQELLNRARAGRAEFAINDKNSGDEIDQSVAFLNEHHFLITQERIRLQLLEIEFALGRMERGEFGICEETFEPIETDRLLALPYTRLSIEGAEIRDSLRKKFADLE